jgi:hypothetical protein
MEHDRHHDEFYGPEDDLMMGLGMFEGDPALDIAIAERVRREGEQGANHSNPGDWFRKGGMVFLVLSLIISILEAVF